MCNGTSQMMSAASNNWQKYRNGNLREPWNLERLARHRAAKLGYRVHRSRRRKGRDNEGHFMLIHKASSTVLLGTGFTATSHPHAGPNGKARGSTADSIP
jgi:hypothetical protein